MRGEKQDISISFASDGGSPPLARGKVNDSPNQRTHTGITPACAGKSFLFYDIRFTPKDHPRLRGEKQNYCIFSWFVVGSPPLARGKELSKNNSKSMFGITPACAGKRMMRLCPLTGNKDHPRLRGEKSNMKKATETMMGSPPLARGKVRGCIASILLVGITPACAGKSRNCTISG